MSEIPKFREFMMETSRENGVPKRVAEYFWDVICQRQLGYAFSILHSAIYSFVALQCAWLNCKYDPIFWKTACLIVDSGAYNNDTDAEDDFDGEVGEQVKQKEKNTDYGKLATAISAFQKEGVKILLPDINKSHFIFEPNPIENAIYYGLKGVKKVNQEIIETIVANRPYHSLDDFLSKVKIQRTVGYSLIKAGAFDALEKRSREEILSDYATYHAKQIKKATLTQAKRLIELGAVPETLKASTSVYEFNRYIRQPDFKKEEDYYFLDNRALSFFEPRFSTELIIYEEAGAKISRKTWEGIYKKETAPLSEWIKANNESLLSLLNDQAIGSEFEDQCKGNVSKWEMETLSFYYHEHELANLDFQKYGVEDFFTLPEQVKMDVTWKGKFSKKKVPLTRIAGTVLDKNKNRHTLSLLTPTGVVQVKFHPARFAKYEKQLSEVDAETGKKSIVEKGWFTKGTLLMVTGYRRGDQFVVKVHEDFAVPVYKIEEVVGSDITLNSTRDMDKIGGEEWV